MGEYNEFEGWHEPITSAERQRWLQEYTRERDWITCSEVAKLLARYEFALTQAEERLRQARNILEQLSINRSSQQSPFLEAIRDWLNGGA